MPDPKKLQRLTDIGYQVQACCGTCKFGQFTGSRWGSCSVNEYEHAKHGTKQLSVYQAGVCGEFVADPVSQDDLALSGFDRFEDSRMQLDRREREGS